MTTAFQQMNAPQVAALQRLRDRTASPLRDLVEDLENTISALELAQRHVRHPDLARLFHELATTRRLVLTETARTAHVNNVAVPKRDKHGPAFSFLLTVQTLLLGDEATLRHLIVTDLRALDRTAAALENDMPPSIPSAFTLAAECLRSSVARLERELI